MTPNKTVPMRAREGVPDLLDFRLCVKDGKLALDEQYARRAQTRDALLTAVDPNDKPIQSPIAGTGNAGRVWLGIERDLNSLPAAVRDEVGKMFMSYALGQGWRVDASGTAVTTGDALRVTDWAQQGRDTANTIRGLNDANRAYWAKQASHRSTATADGRAVDRRREAADGAALAGVTRELVSSINEANRKHWADIEAARARR